VLLALVLVYGIAVVNSSSSSGDKARTVGLNYDKSRGAGSSSDRAQRKKQFKNECHAAIESESDLDASDVDEYTEYVETFDKLDRYLQHLHDGHDGCNLTRNYRAYEHNKRRIAQLNAKAARFEVVNGRVFKENYAVNEFTDCDDVCRAEYLEKDFTFPRTSNPKRRHLQKYIQSAGYSEWELEPDCIVLDQDYFAGVNADTTKQDSMWSQECGAVKDQGVLGTCWAFASTAQFQCNFNAAHQERRVFSEKYATDCSGSAEGKVGAEEGGWQENLDEFYTDNGACSKYHKAYDDTDPTNYDGDCSCDVEKEHGQCYHFYTSIDAKGKLAIANAAQLYALSFGVALCSSFYDVGGDNAVWFGCGDNEQPYPGGHAMTIVGQVAGRYVLVRNSWGTRVRSTNAAHLWGSRTEPGHVWFHSDVWSSAAFAQWAKWAPFSFSYFRPQPHSEHESPTAKCHDQGPCDSGFMDTSDGAFTYDSCAADCEGGAYYADSTSACNCVCQTVGTCDGANEPVGKEDKDEDAGCPLVSSGFNGVADVLNGDWTYLGEHSGKAYYQNDRLTPDVFVVYSYGEYIITDVIDGTSYICKCGGTELELSECEWNCWNGINPSATTLTDCGSSAPRARSDADAQLTDNENQNRIKLVAPRRPREFEAQPAKDVDPALIAITMDQALVLAVALLICVNFCVAMKIMRRRAGTCRKTRRVEDSETETEQAMQSEAEQMLQPSN